MCKALSHEIVIGPVRLLAKHGGKRDRDAAPRMTALAPLYGLVLAGGASRAWGATRRRSTTHGRTQLDCGVRPARASLRAGVRVGARRPGRGSGARSAAADRRPATRAAGRSRASPRHWPRIPTSAWLVVACDLPFLERRDARCTSSRARGREPVHGVPQRARRLARTAVRDLRAGDPRRGIDAAIAQRHATARASSSSGAACRCSSSPIRRRSTTSTRPMT